jgi:cell division protein FtsW
VSSNLWSTRLPNPPHIQRLKAAPRIDYLLLAVVVLLCVWGLLTVLSASAPAAEVEHHNPLLFFIRQSFWMVLGSGALIAGIGMKLSRLRRYSKALMMLTGALLVLPHVPHLGVTELGASRWIRLGPISLQPSEFAKLTLAIYGADLLARFGATGWSPTQVRQALLPMGGIMALVLFQPDLGSTLVLALAAFVLFFCNGTSLLTLFILGSTAMGGMLYHSLHTPYQRLRWLGFMNPWSDPRGIGFQLVQSLMAVGSGGLFGMGWGQGKEKLFWLPIQYADFIFAVLAEEMGLMGSLGVLGLFLLLAWRGFAVAGQAKDSFQALLAIALTTLVVGQALINIGVVTASLPTTGIPLPFLSFGGTSLLTTLFSIGLILNVSRQASRRSLKET